jgi:hypothetical protein
LIKKSKVTIDKVSLNNLLKESSNLTNKLKTLNSGNSAQTTNLSAANKSHSEANITHKSVANRTLSEDTNKLTSMNS